MYDNSKGTAPTMDNLNLLGGNCPRSTHNLSCKEDTSLQIGAITPIDLIDLDINSDVKATYSVLAILRNPLARRLLSGMRIYLHAFYSKKSDLWEGYDVKATGGRLGDVVKNEPRILVRDNEYANEDELGTMNDYSTPMSLADHLGLPVTSIDYENADHKDKNTWFTRLLVKEKYGDDFKSYTNNVNFLGSYSAPDLPSGGMCASALPFVMYQNICRNNFFATDLLLKNKEWYPDFDDHWILPYNIPQYEWDAVHKQFTTKPSNNYVNVLSHEHPTWSKASLDDLDWSPDGSVYVPLDDDEKAISGGTIKNKEVPPILTALHFRQFRGDYFNTASIYPDLIRGEIPTIKDFANLDFSGLLAKPSDFVSDIGFKGSDGDYYDGALSLVNQKVEGFDNYFLALLQNPNYLQSSSSDWISRSIGPTSPYTVQSNWKPTEESQALLSNLFGKVKVISGITRNELNEMLVATAMKERQARTDGSYNQIMQSMFGYNPHHHTHEAQYLGGSYMDLQLSDVVSRTETDDMPLGTTVSRGIAQGDLTINFHSPDNGYLMVVAEVVPDTFYCNQGIDKFWTETSHDSQYFPLQNNLGPVAIRNKEIYLSETSSENDDVFGYTERGKDRQSRRNRLSGMFALPETIASDDARQHMKRHFDSLPVLNNEFVTMSPKNIDMSIFVDAFDVPFNACISKNVAVTSPRPYSSVPFNGGIKF